MTTVQFSKEDCVGTQLSFLQGKFLTFEMIGFFIDDFLYLKLKALRSTLGL